nr:hypothetical protein [Desulfobulbaceae bacterium]
MKKIITTVALVAAIALGSQAAQARWGQGAGTNFTPGSCGNCDQNAAVDSEARQTFLADTEELRTQLREIRTEYFTLMNSDTVDKDEAQILWGEMFDLQQQIQEKATEAGLDPQAGRGGKFGNGQGRGCGSNGGGNGQGCGSFGGVNGQNCYQNNTNAPTE